MPDENHWVLKPQNSILWHHTVLDWLDQWNGIEVNATSIVPVQTVPDENASGIPRISFPVLVS